jgi:hypothetical protein
MTRIKFFYSYIEAVEWVDDHPGYYCSDIFAINNGYGVEYCRRKDQE